MVFKALHDVRVEIGRKGWLELICYTCSKPIIETHCPTPNQLVEYQRAHEQNNAQNQHS